MANEPEEQDFLRRWSRRKLEASAAVKEEQVPDRSPPAAPTAQKRPPPLESLDEESDYSLFLAPEVEESLRRLALRKLFHSALFNVRDGLDDYDDDFAEAGEALVEQIREHLDGWMEEPETGGVPKMAEADARPPEHTGETKRMEEEEEG